MHFDQNNDGKLVFSEFSDGFMRSNALPSSKSPLNTDTSPSKTPKRKEEVRKKKEKEHDPSTLSTDGRDAATKTEQKEDGGTQNGNQHKVEAEMATWILTGKP